MTVYETIRNDIKDAMRAKDAVRLSTLRGVIATCTNELVANGRKPDEMLSDEEVLAIVRRLVKQRKDSIEQFTKGGRADLAEKERVELTVLEAYLPKMLSKEDIERVVREKKDALGITDASQSGKLIGAVMQELKGKADGADVKAVVTSLLSQ